MNYKIEPVVKSDYGQLIEVWEASVRATHHFLPEADIQYFKPLILDKYFDAVELSCVKENGKIIAFMGVEADMCHMLFIHPDHFGKKIGTQLMKYAIEHFNVSKVDVNEDNPGAHKFYLALGFDVVSRDPVDSLGKPYPILHMELKK